MYSQSKRAKGLYRAPLETLPNEKLDSTIVTGSSRRSKLHITCLYPSSYAQDMKKTKIDDVSSGTHVGRTNVHMTSMWQEETGRQGRTHASPSRTGPTLAGRVGAARWRPRPRAGAHGRARALTPPSHMASAGWPASTHADPPSGRAGE
jgi:hypothetical protein